MSKWQRFLDRDFIKVELTWRAAIVVALTAVVFIWLVPVVLWPATSLAVWAFVMPGIATTHPTFWNGPIYGYLGSGIATAVAVALALGILSWICKALGLMGDEE